MTGGGHTPGRGDLCSIMTVVTHGPSHPTLLS
jgi:hypothetical protein